MSFFANVGYKFPLPNDATADGSVLLCSAMPMHQLLRRKRQKHPHMQTLVFDPQLYMATLSPNQARKQCVRLSSYPWFGVKLPPYDSSQQRQKDWKDAAEVQISALWPGKPPTEDSKIDDAVREAVDFQVKIGCATIVLPSPLTDDPATNYDVELNWLDRGLAYCRSSGVTLPIYATVALADLCVRYADPTSNALLDAILDAVSARGVHGAYIVIEQGGEPSDSRQCATKRTVWSTLHLAYLLRADCNVTSLVNFMGSAGLLASATSDGGWASGWYKSLHRLRFADQAESGRAYPMYWAHPCAIDIHLEQDFDNAVVAGLLPAISDPTGASAGLLSAASKGIKVNQVPPWRFQQSNVDTAAEHFFMSSVEADRRLRAISTLTGRLDHVEQWLTDAMARCRSLGSALGGNAKTRMNHVTGWLDALRAHRTAHQL